MKALLAALLLAGCAMHDLRRVPDGAVVDPEADHAPHPWAQTEWWHVHADLHDADGHPLHLFAAFLVQRTDLDRVALVPVPLAVNPFHAAYARLQDETRAWSADRYAFPDLFAAWMAKGRLDVRHNDWRLSREEGTLVLRLSVGPHRLHLRLQDAPGTVLPGAAGRVEIPAGSPHLWLQQEAMPVEGRWVRGGRTRWVEGTGFYKHQWGRIYSPEMDGFQWFSMDFPEGHSLSVGWLQDDGMHGVDGSVVFLSDRSGRHVPLPASALQVTPTRTWTSHRTGARWPVAWDLQAEGLALQVTCLREDQELWAFPAPLHVGPARASGTFLGRTVEVPAFVEQVGAVVPALRPLFSSRAPR